MSTLRAVTPRIDQSASERGVRGVLQSQTRAACVIGLQEFGKISYGASNANRSPLKPTIEPRKEVVIMLKRILLLIALLAGTASSTLALTACNTIEGAGKDISHAGSAIQDEARENK